MGPDGQQTATEWRERSVERCLDCTVVSSFSFLPLATHSAPLNASPQRAPPCEREQWSAPSSIRALSALLLHRPASRCMRVCCSLLLACSLALCPVLCAACSCAALSCRGSIINVKEDGRREQEKATATEKSPRNSKIGLLSRSSKTIFICADTVQSASSGTVHADTC